MTFSELLDQGATIALLLFPNVFTQLDLSIGPLLAFWAATFFLLFFPLYGRRR